MVLKNKNLRGFIPGPKHPEALFRAAVSGALLTAAFPKTGLDSLAWIALVPLFLSLRNLAPWAAFRTGFLAGLVHYLTLVYWLVHTMQTYGNLPFFLAVPALLLLASYLALYVGLFSLVMTLPPVRNDTVRMLLLAPAVWVGLEYTRSFLLSGFPWALLGYSQYQRLHLIQVSDIIGVYGVSFLIVLVNAAVGMIVFHFRRMTWQGRPVSGRKAAAAAAVAVTVLAATLLYGGWRIRDIDRQMADAQKLRTTVVQGNIDQMVKWRQDYQLYTTDKYVRLSLSARRETPDLVVWPETAAPFYMFHNVGLTTRVLRGIRQAGSWFLIGSPAFTREADRNLLFNSAYLVGPTGEKAGRYDKVHLVPFGEYVPLQRFLPFIEKLVEQVGDFSRGRPGETLRMEDHDLGVLICYEVIFPRLARAAARNGAEILVNITNDAWYGTTSAPYQHFSMTIFRAVETRRALVRSANTGISGFIDPAGRINGATGLFEDAVMTRPLPVLKDRTVYVRTGDVFAGLCAGGTGLIILLSLYRRKRT